MLGRVIAGVGVVAVVVVATLPLSRASGQGSGTEATKAAPPTPWKPIYKADGQPDIEGTWVNFDATPFESGGGRNRPYGARQFAEQITSESRIPEKRMAMVVEPADGRVQILPWAEKQRDYNAAHSGVSWLFSTTWERCITRGVPGGMFPGTYNNGYQIVQGRGYVAIVYEMIHDPRIIPVDGSAHLPSSVRLWNGDSRGRWEGSTLVVDVTNYHSKGQIATGSSNGRLRGLPQSEELHVVERFTRIDASTINYEATIDDPKVYGSPWKVMMPLTLDNSYQIFEYACHEGNSGYMETNLGGGAADARAAAQKAKTRN